MALTPGARVGPYEITATLGSGGMGDVYCAQDTRLDRLLALKLLPADFTSDPDRLRRFVLEAKAASALNHPNILTIYEVGQADGHQFIAAELVAGETLRQRMNRARLSTSMALDVAIQIGNALAAAHASSIVHRDIKPENVMVRPDGLVKVLDFGLAKLTERGSLADPNASTRAVAATSPGMVLGTASYMSPEQARGIDVDARTDIFSLGVVLYEMLSGRSPFERDTVSDSMAAILTFHPPPLASEVRGLPPALERAVAKALRKDREERYQGVRDLIVDLKDLKQEVEIGCARRRGRAFSRGRLGASSKGKAKDQWARARREGRPPQVRAARPGYGASGDDGDGRRSARRCWPRGRGDVLRMARLAARRPTQCPRRRRPRRLRQRDGRRGVRRRPQTGAGRGARAVAICRDRVRRTRGGHTAPDGTGARGTRDARDRARDLPASGPESADRRVNLQSGQPLRHLARSRQWADRRRDRARAGRSRRQRAGA